MKQGKAPFSLQKRPSCKKEIEKKRQGKKYKIIYFVQFRDTEGNYTSAISTGQTSKGAAIRWAYNYLKKGHIPTHRGFTFKRYSKNWWIPGECDYLEEKERTGHALSPRYIQESRRNLDKRLILYFGNMKMTIISFKDIRKWMFNLYENQNVNPATINRSLATLKIMLKQAVLMEYIQSNPAQDIGIFKEEPKSKTVLNLKEVDKLFDERRIEDYWNGDLYHYTFNLIAASTGMRLGELQALKRKYINEDTIEVVHSWSRKFGIKDTKNHTRRLVPLSDLTKKYLNIFLVQSPNRDPEDLVFAGSDRYKPFDGKKIDKCLYKALGKIGVTPEERKSRNVTFHSWRYFFNTVCRSNKIPDSKIRIVMGHKTALMTDRYTSLLHENLNEIRQFQNTIFSTKAA